MRTLTVEEQRQAQERVYIKRIARLQSAQRADGMSSPSEWGTAQVAWATRRYHRAQEVDRLYSLIADLHQN